MTDNEIVKALERRNTNVGCTDCLDVWKSMEEASKHFNKRITTIRNKAITEFAERLKKRIHNLEYTANLNRKTVPVEALVDQGNWILHEAVISVIDELLSEMTEDDNGA